jgi:flagella basal body P-ring formation protein FlgA
MSRLASSGVLAKDVRLTGAEKITVTRSEKVIDAEKLITLAESFINKARPISKQAKWRLLRRPDDLTSPETADVKLQARMGPALSGGCVCVEVAMFRGRREIGVAKVLFKQVYSMRQLIAARNIPAGTVLSEKNTRIEVVTVSRKPDEWKSPYGMICSQAVQAGRVIRPTLWKTQKPTIMVHRNKPVRMKIQMTGFMIVATGQALQDGRVGDLIKVRNVDSKRIIMAMVGADGTVTPVNNNKR